MPLIRVYLAGDVSSQAWRLRVMRECHGLNIEWLIPSAIKEEPEKPIKFMTDVLKIRQADIIFAYIAQDVSRAFSGTSWEAGGGYFLNKPVILVNEKDGTGDYDLINFMANAYYPTLEGGINHLKKLAKEMDYMPREKRFGFLP